MKKILFLISILLLTSCTKYQQGEFVIEKKSEYPDQWFLIKKVPVFPLKDTLFTVININNYHYMDHELWDQMYFSYNVHDTIYLSIKKENFWKKINVNE